MTSPASNTPSVLLREAIDTMEAEGAFAVLVNGDIYKAMLEDAASAFAGSPTLKCGDVSEGNEERAGAA